MSLTLTPLLSSEAEETEYPEDNGEPMSENTLQFSWIVLLKEGLEAQFADAADVFIAGDLLWYPVQNNKTLCYAPDVMVAFGRPKGYRSSYLQWQEAGIPPQVVFEILSPGNRAREMRRKLAFYEEYGVEEYYVYDPHSLRFSASIRTEDGSRLVLAETVDGWTSPRLGVTFFPFPDAQMQILHPDGTPFRSYTQVVQERITATVERDAAQREKLRAEQERERERERGDAAERKTQELIAKLRAAGIDPDKL